MFGKNYIYLESVKEPLNEVEVKSIERMYGLFYEKLPLYKRFFCYVYNDIAVLKLENEIKEFYQAYLIICKILSHPDTYLKEEIIATVADLDKKLDNIKKRRNILTKILGKNKSIFLARLSKIIEFAEEQLKEAKAFLYKLR